jgi:hypothetical protein
MRLVPDVNCSGPSVMLTMKEPVSEGVALAYLDSHGVGFN